MPPGDAEPNLDALLGAIFNAVADYGGLSPERQEAALAADDTLVVDAAVAAFRRRVAQGRRAAAIRAAPPEDRATVVLAEHLWQAQWSPAACLGLASRLLRSGSLQVGDAGSEPTAAALAGLLRQARLSAGPAGGKIAEGAVVDLSAALPTKAAPVALPATIAARRHASEAVRMVLAVRADDGPSTVLVLPDISCLTVWSSRALHAAGVDVDTPDELSGTEPVRFRLAIATVPPR